MPDVRDLLSDAAGEPVRPLDLDAVLRRGARRTARRRALAVSAGVLPVVAGLVLVLGRGSSSPHHDELVPAGPVLAPSASPAPVAPAVPRRTAAPAPTRAGTHGPRHRDGGRRLPHPVTGHRLLLRHDGTAVSAECGVQGNTWTLPPTPADCAFDYGHSVATGPSGSTLTCRSDTFYDPAAEVVPYGTTVRSGELDCQVARTGVTCRDTTTGARFSVSKAAYRLS